MKKYSLALSFAITALLFGCSPVDSMKTFDHQQAALLLKQNYLSHPTKQQIAIRLPHAKQWKRIDLSYGTVGSPIMLVPYQESETNWTESIRTKITDNYHFPDMTAKRFVENQIQQAKDNCSKVNAAILVNQSSYCLFRLEMKGCRRQKDQLRIGKAFNGSDAVYLVYYSAVITQPTVVSAEELKRMSVMIGTAKLATQ